MFIISSNKYFLAIKAVNMLINTTLDRYLDKIFIYVTLQILIVYNQIGPKSLGRLL